MLWASFRVLNVLRHYVKRALGMFFSVLTTTVASVGESQVSRVTSSTSEGQGYYYDCLWPLDWHQMIWLILIRWIGSWDLIHVDHVYWGYGLGVYLYPSFFTSFLILNHSLHLFFDTLSSQKDISILLHSFENVSEWEWSSMGAVPLWST